MATINSGTQELDVLMTTGVTKQTALSPFPNKNELFQKMEQGFINEGGRFKCRGGFELLQEFSVTGRTREEPMFMMFIGRFLIVFNADTTGGGVTSSYQMRYTTFDTALNQIRQEDSLFLGSDYFFYPDQFDAVSARITNTSGSQLDGHYWFCGGGEMYECTFSTSTGLFTLSKTIKNVQPYAITQIGSFIVYLAYSKTTQPYTDGKYYKETVMHQGRECVIEYIPKKGKAAVAVSPAPEKKYGRILKMLPAGDTQGDTYNMMFDAGEVIYRSFFFAETLFFVTNKGLRGVEFKGDNSEVTSGLHRRISPFTGKNVKPRSVVGQALLYFADEVRLRDISSMQTGISFAGDYVATPFSQKIEASDSCYIPQEDVVLVREGLHTVHALWVGKDERGLLKITPTVFINNEDWNIAGMANDETNLAIVSWHIPVGETDKKYVTLVYKKGKEKDYINSDTEEKDIIHTFQAARFSYVTTMEELRLHIAKQASSDVVISNDEKTRALYDSDVNIILTNTTHVGGEYYAGDITVTFHATVPVEVLTAKLFFTPRMA